MTTTEAIKQLQTEHDLIAGEYDLDGSQFAPALLEALAMAIEALKCSEIPNYSEPKCADGCIYGWGSSECGHCDYRSEEPKTGDTISRKAAIDEIKALYEWHDTVTEDRTIDHLKRLPSAQPKPDKNPLPEQPDSDRLGVKTGETCTDAISRQAAIDRLTEYGNGRAVFISVGEAIIRIEQLPPAQPERIVRCKDCKHWIPYDWMFSEVWRSKNIADYSEDEIGCNLCDMAMKADDFCSRADMRGENNESN